MSHVGVRTVLPTNWIEQYGSCVPSVAVFLIPRASITTMVSFPATLVLIVTVCGTGSVVRHASGC